jgi:hypothetical protein
MTDFALLLILALTVKHFICDFPLQMDPWMYRNKGTYGHLGGVCHAGIHAEGTCLALLLVMPKAPEAVGPILLAAFADGVIHYHIDWLKMRLNARWQLGPTTSEWFWVLLGADQLLHAITYIVIVWMLLA